MKVDGVIMGVGGSDDGGGCCEPVVDCKRRKRGGGVVVEVVGLGEERENKLLGKRARKERGDQVRAVKQRYMELKMTTF